MTDRRAELTIAHHHPGRLRLRSRSFEGRAGAEVGAAACDAVARARGVRHARADARTGSVLVLYDPAETHADDLVRVVAEASGLPVGDGRPAPGDEDHLALVAIDAVREANAIVQDLTHHRADLRILVPAALAGLGVWSAATRGVRLPGWDNLVYWAYSIFVAVNEREIEARTGEAPLRASTA